MKPIQIFSEIALPAVASLLVIILTFIVFNKSGRSRVNKWLDQDIGLLNASEIETFIEALDVDTNKRAAYGERILRQYNYIKEKALQHLRIMIHFQIRYYTIINITAICGIIAGVLAFFLMNQGWLGTGWILKTLFITFSSSTIYAAAFPKFFAHRYNIMTNKVRALRYRNLLNRIETFTCTGLDSTKSKRAVDSFIVFIDDQIEEISDYTVKFEFNTNFKSIGLFHPQI